MTTKSGRHMVTVLLTDEHLRKMVDNRLLKEEEMGDRVKIAGIVLKLLDNRLGLPDEQWHDWGDWGKGLE